MYKDDVRKMNTIINNNQWRGWSIKSTLQQDPFLNDNEQQQIVQDNNNSTTDDNQYILELEPIWRERILNSIEKRNNNNKSTTNNSQEIEILRKKLKDKFDAELKAMNRKVS
jgi:hypothetical protein